MTPEEYEAEKKRLLMWMSNEEWQMYGAYDPGRDSEKDEGWGFGLCVIFFIVVAVLAVFAPEVNFWVKFWIIFCFSGLIGVEIFCRRVEASRRAKSKKTVQAKKN